MPLRLTVGQSRKVSENYNSRGFSMHVEAELPASAIENADTIARSANHLFQLVDDLLMEQIRNAGQVDGNDVPPRLENVPNQRATPATNGKPTNGNQKSPNQQGRANSGNGSAVNTAPIRSITNAQSKAIMNMAARLDLDLEQSVRDEFGTELTKLTIGQASQFIDQLKERFTPASGKAYA